MGAASIVRCCLSLLPTSFFFSFITYMTAYDVQSRSWVPNRFSSVEKGALNFWGRFIAFPRGDFGQYKKPFCITVVGEKIAIINFLSDIVALPVLVIGFSRLTTQRDSVYLWCFLFLFIAPFAATSWIRWVEHHIVKLPQNSLITDAQLDKHIKNCMKQLSSQYAAPEFQTSLTVKKSSSMFETKEIYMASISTSNKKPVYKSVLATKKTSKYYIGNNITLS